MRIADFRLKDAMDDLKKFNIRLSQLNRTINSSLTEFNAIEILQLDRKMDGFDVWLKNIEYKINIINPTKDKSPFAQQNRDFVNGRKGSLNDQISRTRKKWNNTRSKIFKKSKRKPNLQLGTLVQSSSYNETTYQQQLKTGSEFNALLLLFTLSVELIVNKIKKNR